MTHERYKRYMHSRKYGYGMNLYRNTRKKKIGGVCAGLGDHFEIDHNVMRIIFVAALLFTGVVAFWSYIIAWCILVPKTSDENPPQYEYDERERGYRKKKIFRYKESSSDRLKKANSKLNDTLQRVEEMEHYVTSKRFNLDQEFADLQK